MSKKRSPNYPYIDLEKAVDLARSFFDAYQKNDAAVELTAKHWGFNGLNGSALKTIAAMDAYGLIDKDKKNKRIKLSDSAIKLSLGGTPENERTNILKQCALGPKLFDSLYNKYDFPLPPEQSLVYDLVTNEGFSSEDAASVAVKNFLNTLSYAGIQESDIKTQDKEGGQEEEIEENLDIDTAPEVGHNVPQVTGMTPLPQHIMRSDLMEAKTTVDSGPVTLTFPASLSEEDAADIEDWLDYIKRKIKRATNVKTDFAKTEE